MDSINLKVQETMRGDKGRAVAFEAKSTENTNHFYLKNIAQQQLDYLEKAEKMGAICFFLIEFGKDKAVFVVQLSVIQSYVRISHQPKENKTIGVTAGYGHVKLWWENNGSGPVAIILKHNASGKEYVTAKLEKGNTLTFRSNDLYPQGMIAGAYTISDDGGSYN